MSKYLAFLRGVNVGGRIIKMADLKACLEELGFQGVTTLLQSGNVILESDFGSAKAVRTKMEEGVGKKFGYDAKILIYKDTDLKPIVDAYPFDSSDEQFQHYVVLMDQKSDELAAEAVDLDPSVEEVQPGSGVVYWRVLKGMTLDSNFGKKLSKPQFKNFLTNRNIKTLKKIIAKVTA